MNKILKYRLLFFLDVSIAAGMMYFFVSRGFSQKASPGKYAGALVWVWYSVRVLILIHAVYCWLKLMHISLVKNKMSSRTRLSIYSLITFLLFCEIVFMFVPQSQGNTQFGLGTRVWNTFYASRNEKKYRDKMLAGRITTSKKKVFFLGDSFTYGNGIKNEEDRFSNIIARNIEPKKYEVFNLGKGNSDTRDEFLRLVQFGLPPDILVLQFCFNDIEPIAQQFSDAKEKNAPAKNSFSFGAAILQSSFFLNFVAVNLAKFSPAFQLPEYKKKIAGSYHDANIMKEEFRFLKGIMDYCSINRTKLYVLLVPDMRQPEFTEKECYPVLKLFFKEKNIPCISIYNEIKDMPVVDRVVSSTDAHANEAVQKIIATQLLGEIKEFGN